MRGFLGKVIPVGCAGALVVVIGAGGVQPLEAGGGCRGFPSTEGSGKAVKMNDSCFLPTVLYVVPGTTVSFENASSQPHSVSGATLEWGNYNEIRTGQSSGYTFDKAGTYPYYCSVHNGMTGAIVVGDGVGNGVSLPPVEKPVQAVVVPQNASAARPVLDAPASAADSTDTDSMRTPIAAFAGAIAGSVAVMAGLGVRSLRKH